MVQEDTISDAAVEAIRENYNNTDMMVIDDFQNTVTSNVIAFRMQICSASNFICHLLINSLLHVSCLPGSITALSLYHCSLIAVDGIITRTGYSPTTSLIYRKAAFLNLANVLLRVTVILVKVAAAVAVAAAAVVTVITALSLGTCISTERLVVLSSGTVLQLCHSSPSLSSRHIRAVGTVSLMQ